MLDPETRHRVLLALGAIDARHLPGQHDQDKHGRGGSGLKPAEARVWQALSDIQTSPGVEVSLFRSTRAGQRRAPGGRRRRTRGAVPP